MPEDTGSSITPERFAKLEAENADYKARSSKFESRMAEMRGLLTTARGQIVTLKEEIDRLAQPPNGFGIFMRKYEDGTVEVFTGGRKLRVAVSPTLEEELRPGQEVMLNDALNVVKAFEFERTGAVVTVKEILEGGDRALVVDHAEESSVVYLADPLINEPPKAGDSLMVKSGFAYERIPKSEVEELLMEEVPDVSISDIGGLDEQIEDIMDAVGLNILHPELFLEHQLRAPKGILLYGPPGCGKTMIAKAVACWLAQQIEKKGKGKKTAHFINIKGPELLNKYVGETERKIRDIFQRAREKAGDGTPVIIFFDEMDAIFRTRGSGISSDVQNTIVPQILAEIDGVEELNNVLVIGASNREDMIDPALLRPGRLDVKIKVGRPDAEAARQIFAKYLTPNLPLCGEELNDAFGGDRQTYVDSLIQAAVEKVYAEEEDNEFLEVTYASGSKETLYFKDFNSGAMIEDIVARAKKMSIKAFLQSGMKPESKGIRLKHLLDACVDEFRENEDLPSTTNPDDWARISGKKGERIVYIRTLVSEKRNKHVETETARGPGQYL